MTPQQFYNHYESNGFIFSKSILTRYCLSLKTKPFAILSGISGTGKTKIAQLFNVIDNNNDEAVQQAGAQAQQGLQAGGFIILNVTQGVLDGDRGNFKFGDLGIIFEAAQIPHIESSIQEKRDNNDGGNIIDPARMIIETPDGQELTISIYLQRAASPLVRVRFKSKAKEENPFDSSGYMRDNYNLDDKLRLEKIAPGRFKIVSVNDEAVIQANQQIEASEATLVDNTLFVSVKSNWTDSSELFGHFNMLNEEYQMTEVLRFIMRAHEHPTRPFFLILDEMNLSKVEHYFSDFLSCLESRFMVGDEMHQEAIQLHDFSGFVNSSDEVYDTVPGRIEIPANLYVTGTVNIDESTYMFSPKVLDRANVIEFNEVDLDNYENPQAAAGGDFALTTFPSFESSVLATRSAYMESPDLFKQMSRELVTGLQPYNMHFGYRVINEMALFVNNACAHINDSVETQKQAIDIQITQKVLPKFSGAYGKLDEPLRYLISKLASEELQPESLDLDSVNDINVQASDYPLSLRKLIRMYRSLLVNGFASYLE